MLNFVWLLSLPRPSSLKGPPHCCLLSRLHFTPHHCVLALQDAGPAIIYHLCPITYDLLISQDSIELSSLVMGREEVSSKILSTLDMVYTYT